MKYLYFFYCIAFICINVSCSSDDSKDTSNPDLSSESKTVLNVSYGSDPQQIYDLYLPKNRSTTTTKTIILVHGGGWTEGDKKDMNGFIELLQKRDKNYAIVNMNYILANETTKAYPNQINDIQSVVSHLKSKSEEYQIKPEFAFIGVSAGAHLSLLYSYAFDTDNEVKMVATVVGPTDFTDPIYRNNAQYIDAFPFLVEDFNPDNIAMLQQLSPSYQVTASSPPTILFYGNKDPLIPNTQHESLKKSLEEFEIIHERTVYEGGHGDWNPSSYIDLDAKLNLFLETHL